MKLSPYALLKSGENFRPRLASLPTKLRFWQAEAWLATWFYSGLVRPASGTWGSLAGFLCAALFSSLPLSSAWQQMTALSAIIIFFGLGVWSGGAYAAAENKGDPASVVIDEVVGIWITFLFVPHHIGWWAAAFVAFRGFDIVKPYPANWCDRHIKGGVFKDGLGIMLDDVVAGIYAGAVVWGMVWVVDLWH